MNGNRKAEQTGGTGKIEARQITPNDRIIQLLKTESPDDFVDNDTAAKKEELIKIAQDVIDGKTEITHEARKCLIRAFLFGILDKLDPDVELAVDLLPENIGSLEDADYVFFISELNWRMARIAEEKERKGKFEKANETLVLAANMGSKEALAKHWEGGYIDPDKLEFTWEEGVDAVLVGATFGLAALFKKGEFEKASLDFLKLKANCYCNMRTLSDIIYKYNLVKTAYVMEKRPMNDSDYVTARVSILLGRQGGTYLTSEKLKGYRKYIVCTEEGCKFFKADKEAKFYMTRKYEPTENPMKEVLPIPVCDINCYNEAIRKLYPGDKSKELIFEKGHPQNGHTYVQHPYRQNEYLELSSFHWSLLKEKFDELARVMESLGAKEIHCSVTDTYGKRIDSRTAYDEHLSGLYKGVGVGVGSSQAFSSAFSYSLAHEMELNKTYNPHKPVFPSDRTKFPFFFDQKDWQTTAKEVCDGVLKEADFRLTCKEDYAINKSAKVRLDAEVSAGVVNGKVQGGVEMEKGLQVAKSLIWTYHVKFQ